jgi:hypothetical protein
MEGTLLCSSLSSTEPSVDVAPSVDPMRACSGWLGEASDSPSAHSHAKVTAPVPVCCSLSQGHLREALVVFRKLQRDPWMKIDNVTLLLHWHRAQMLAPGQLQPMWGFQSGPRRALPPSLLELQWFPSATRPPLPSESLLHLAVGEGKDRGSLRLDIQVQHFGSSRPRAQHLCSGKFFL